MWYLANISFIARIYHPPGTPWYEKFFVEILIFGTVSIAFIILRIILGPFLNNLRKKDFPLHYAAETGSKDEIESLLSKGVNINFVDRDGNTPLHEAAKNGKVEVVDLLLRRGASVNAKNKGGSTPLDLAMTYKDNDKVVDILHRHGGVRLIK